MNARRRRAIPPPDVARRQLGLPAAAQFVGFGVHLPRTDEFLALARPGPGLDHWGWTPVPNYAIHFEGFADASRLAARYGKGAVVVYMFDLGDQYVVAKPE